MARRGKQPTGDRKNAKISRLAPALLSWFEKNARDLPWRQTNDPYGIWVSEIMTSDTYTQYGSVVRLHGKSLAFLGYHSSKLETMAFIFR